MSLIPEFFEQHWVNGIPSTHIDVRDRGLQYGHGVFETVVIKDGEPKLWSYHAKRLRSGLQLLGISFDIEPLVCFIYALAVKLEHCILKVTVTAGCADRGYAYISGKPTSLVSAYAPVCFNQARQQGFSSFFCAHRLSASYFSAIKHLNRLESVMAASECKEKGYDEGLLLSYEGCLIEGIRTNLFIRSGNTWLTPDLSLHGVKGVMRALVMSILDKQGIKVVESAIDYKTIALAQEFFCCNSVMGIVPFVTCEQISFDIGQTTRELQQLTQDYVF